MGSGTAGVDGAAAAAAAAAKATGEAEGVPADDLAFDRGLRRMKPGKIGKVMMRSGRGSGDCLVAVELLYFIFIFYWLGGFLVGFGWWELYNKCRGVFFVSSGMGVYLLYCAHFVCLFREHERARVDGRL